MMYSPAILVSDVPQNTVWETLAQIIRGRWKINRCLASFIIFLNITAYPKIANWINSSLRHGQAVGQLISMAKQVDGYIPDSLNHTLFHRDQIIMCLSIFKDPQKHLERGQYIKSKTDVFPLKNQNNPNFFLSSQLCWRFPDEMIVPIQFICNLRLAKNESIFFNVKSVCHCSYQQNSTVLQGHKHIYPS